MDSYVRTNLKNVLKDYEHLGLNVIGVNARDKFLGELAGVTDPEQKRKIIGKGFIDVFDEERRNLRILNGLVRVQSILMLLSLSISQVRLLRVTTM